MALNSVTTELVTGATDGLLALESLVLVLWLWRTPTADRWRAGLWCWVFGVLAFSSVLGTIAHGFELRVATRDLLWKPLYFSLGILVALFMVGAIHDWRGQPSARRFLPWAVAAGMVFFLLSQFLGGAFVIFVAYEATALLGALAIYSYLAAARRLKSAGLVALGVLLNLAAAGVQVSHASIHFIVPLDHNGLFHIVQMLAAATLGLGLQQGMRPRFPNSYMNPPRLWSQSKPQKKRRNMESLSNKQVTPTV